MYLPGSEVGAPVEVVLVPVELPHGHEVVGAGEGLARDLAHLVIIMMVIMIMTRNQAQPCLSPWCSCGA